MDISEQLESLYERQRQYTAHYQDFDKLVAEQEAYEASLDRYRHLRMLSLCGSVLKADPGTKWLTVGDGRFGTDARYLTKHGADAVASDIDDSALIVAQQAGLINAFSRENAEALSFENESFDYVMCKEAYHHFPRPMIAVYEMLRVAKKGVILIEPNDRQIVTSSRQVLMGGVGTLIGKLLKREPKPHQYEPAGNYVYSISAVEAEKVACGLGLPEVWIGYMDDEYVEGLGSVPHDPNSKATKKLETKIKLKMTLSRMGAKPWGQIRILIAKQPVSNALAIELRATGFKKFVPPPNPFA